MDLFGAAFQMKVGFERQSDLRQTNLRTCYANAGGVTCGGGLVVSGTRCTEHTKQKSPDEHQLLGRRPTSDVKMVQV